MDKVRFDVGDIDIAWCPGCGNFSILNALKSALAELDITPERLVIVSGIGQAAKLPHYMRTNVFDGLHGRSLPAATAIKAANPELTVIAESGDGCMYGEGGNHFIHAVRRNPDIAHFVHNNMVYGLTKGQASPTSQIGFKTPVQVDGQMHVPFKPIAMALALGATFVARAYGPDVAQTKELMKKAIRHRGYALVDIFQPCVTFNRVNTYEWFKQNTYYLSDSHDALNRRSALEIALERDRLALGVFYENPGKPTFEDKVGVYRDDERPLFKRQEARTKRLRELIDASKQ